MGGPGTEWKNTTGNLQVRRGTVRYWCGSFRRSGSGLLLPTGYQLKKCGELASLVKLK